MKNKGKSSTSSNSNRYFYYTNSIYMGTVKNLQRIGTGLILFHDNTCSLASYNNNSELHGKNVFYKTRSLISVEFVRNRIIDIVYRVDGFLLYLKYNEYAQIDGNCYIISFIDRSIHQLYYQRGHLQSKVKMLTVQKLTVQNIFLNHAFHIIVGKSHNRILNHEITSEQIPKIRVIKLGNKVQAHYMERDERASQGLGFEFIYRSPQLGGYDPQTNRFRDQFQLKIVEKGMYRDNNLEGYGMRLFKNNNMYEGMFQKDAFHGQGCLRNIQKGTWVYGIFSNGQMSDIIDFSNEGSDQVKPKFLLQNLRQTQPNFINQMIQQNNFDFLDLQLQKITKRGDMENQKNLTFQQKKLEMLRKITSQFTQMQPINSNLQVDISKLKNLKQLQSSNDNQNNLDSQRKDSYRIKSFLPSGRANSFIETERMNRQKRQREKKQLKELEDIQNEKKKFERRLLATQPIEPIKTSRTQNQSESPMKVSRIFRKNYDHLGESNQKGLSNQNYIRIEEESANKRNRKSYIFQNIVNNKTTQSIGPEKDQFVASNSPYQRKSPNRKSGIFGTTLRLKKVSPNRHNRTYDQQILGSNRPQSFRRSMNQSKLSKQKLNRSGSPIFQQSKQKDAINSLRFNYIESGDIKTGKNNEKQGKAFNNYSYQQNSGQNKSRIFILKKE